MKTHRVRCFLAALLVLSIPAAQSLAQEAKVNNAVDIQKAQEDQAFALAVEAFIWSYPTVVTAVTAEVGTSTDKPLPNGHAPFNSFGHVAKLFTAADKDVVAVNLDTVYSSAFLDLKQGAALISVGAAGNRYYSLMLVDAYTNVFGYIGSRATGSGPGTYLIVGPNWNGQTPSGATLIKSPTPFVWVIGRTLVDGQKDLPNVAAMQSQYQISIIPPVLDQTPIKQRWNLTLQPKLPPVEQVEALDWKTYFAWAGRLIKDSPPPQSDSALYQQFEAIGLSPKNGFDISGLSPAAKRGLERGYQAGIQIMKMDAQNTGGVQTNGWGYNLNAGKWGQDFNVRAAVAYRGLGQNTPEEALYMNTLQDADKDRLNGSKTYILTFPKGELPPVDAFWSVTMYDSTNFLVDNSINRYAIGNRTEGLVTNPDGSLTIYIQKNQPEGGKKSNWLPAPDGDFRLSMRLYNPKTDVLDGKWTPPGVKLIEVRSAVAAQ